MFGDTGDQHNSGLTDEDISNGKICESICFIADNMELLTTSLDKLPYVVIEHYFGYFLLKIYRIDIKILLY